MHSFEQKRFDCAFAFSEVIKHAFISGISLSLSCYTHIPA